MKTSRAVIHVDMDAFYASVEQLDRPETRGFPVIVGGAGARGVVATASYEARRFGVRSAMPGSIARRLCPAGIFIAPRMDRYVEVSAAVFTILREFTPQVEGLSLDEAFLDVSGSRRLHGAMTDIGPRIRAMIRERLGLACSVGMSHNKLLAKLATELAKPDGCFHLQSEQVREVLDPLPVTRLWTIGKVAGERLLKIGIRTIGELRCAELRLLAGALGSHAIAAQRLASGVDEREVVPDREEKSIGAEHTFETDLDTLDQARHWLMRLCERVGERARAHGLKARTVTVKLRVPPFETSTRQATLAAQIDATGLVYDAAGALLDKWWHERTGRKLRLLGVSLSGFEAHVVSPQAQLFDVPQVEKQPDLVLDRINQRFGRGAIGRARALRPDPTDAD